MSTQVLKNEIMRFLKSSNPEVLCVSGKWGVGKTFCWKAYIAEAGKSPKNINENQYSYTSLFGVNSLPELKYEIFENTVPLSEMSHGASIDTLRRMGASALVPTFLRG